MSKHYIEKALLATTYKIERVKEQSNYIKKNINRVIIIGTLLSFWAPFYTTDNGKSVVDELNLSYTDSVVLTFSIILFFCILGHFVWNFQDKQRIKKLMKKKEELEKQLEYLNRT